MNKQFIKTIFAELPAGRKTGDTLQSLIEQEKRISFATQRVREFEEVRERVKQTIADIEQGLTQQRVKTKTAALVEDVLAQSQSHLERLSSEIHRYKEELRISYEQSYQIAGELSVL